MQRPLFVLSFVAAVEEMGEGRATYICKQTLARRQCRLLPTRSQALSAFPLWNLSHCSFERCSTMGPGLLSERTVELVEALRQRGVLFVVVTGARMASTYSPILLFLSPPPSRGNDSCPAQGRARSWNGFRCYRTLTSPSERRGGGAQLSLVLLPLRSSGLEMAVTAYGRAGS
jgi:hypothetical protein